jgi:hypothetical protein
VGEIADETVEIFAFYIFFCSIIRQTMIGYQFAVWKPIYVMLITHHSLLFLDFRLRKKRVFFSFFQINFTFKLQAIRHGCTVSDQLNRKMGFYRLFDSRFHSPDGSMMMLMMICVVNFVACFQLMCVVRIGKSLIASNRAKTNITIII